MDLTGALTSIIALLMFGTLVKTASDYDFDVFPVDTCPLSKADWDTRSNQLKCNKTHGYHCVPNKDLTSLIEFCYPRGARLPFEPGNCLELAANGILNQIPCEMTFSCGCPDTFFFSSEFYKYPMCLAINTELKCFDADVECKYTRLLDMKRNKENTTCTEMCITDTDKHIINTGKGNAATTIILVGVVIVMVLIILTGIIVYIRKSGKICYKELGKVAWSDLKDSDEQLQALTETGTYIKTRSAIAYLAHRNGLPLSLTPTVDELESEYVIGDMELLLLLRRHCVDGAFENFIYLFERKILKNEKKPLRIIESRDNNGCTLLHYAAKGGSKDILETLLKHCTELTIDDTDHFGHTLLHFACKNGQYDLCAYILSTINYCKRLLTKTSHDGWNAAHFTAISGNVPLFQLIHGKGEIDMQSGTKNGLDILHVACMCKNTSLCKELVSMNEKLKLPLGKADLGGWNIAHYAAKVGNKDVFNYFINAEFAQQKTFHGKTVLHICCECGHYELCELLLKDSPLISKILHDVDDEGWNALHYAAKEGNLNVFKMIEKTLKSSEPLEVFRKKTFYYETVLHICCIHKNVEICRYLCKILKSAPEIVNKVSTNLWTAAHYVAVEIKQDGSEEELIHILVDAGIDLKSQSNLGKTVLTVAFEHRNDNLIDYLLTHHIELVNINTPKLREAAAHSKIYEEKLQKALQKVKRR